MENRQSVLYQTIRMLILSHYPHTHTAAASSQQSNVEQQQQQQHKTAYFTASIFIYLRIHTAALSVHSSFMSLCVNTENKADIFILWRSSTLFFSAPLNYE
jgi:hypothetical protein